MSVSTYFVAGGTLAADAPSYVEREADRLLRDALSQGRLAYVLDTRQVGKSSLMNRTAEPRHSLNTRRVQERLIKPACPSTAPGL